VRLRLSQLLIEGNDAPFFFKDFEQYYATFCSQPDHVSPIEVECAGTMGHMTVYVIRDGRHRFLAAIASGQTHIEAEYKDTVWRSSHVQASTSAAVQQSPSQSPSR
jgi:hypothetical protein